MKEKENNREKRTLPVFFAALFWVIAAGLLAGGATYAWFTFNPVTNITPMGSTISDGDTAIYISTSRDGAYSTQCPMPAVAAGGLSPVSTNDLDNFYEAVMQDRQGISIRYKDVTEQISQKAITGKLYLKSLRDDCSVYLYPPTITLETDKQTMAALRLGMKLTGATGTYTYIMKLDGFSSTYGAEERLTVPNQGTVVSSINTGGAAQYASDTSEDISAFMAGGEAGGITAGAKTLCVLSENEICEVSYWLYLEGCDENCINVVQNKDVGFALGFAAVTKN